MLVDLKAVVKHIHAGCFLRALVFCRLHAQRDGQWLNRLKGTVAGITLLRQQEQYSPTVGATTTNLTAQKALIMMACGQHECKLLRAFHYAGKLWHGRQSSS